ncbi:hypothetical protein HDU79_004085 [Rhizoclosmatium sp. JEL0117]|nr:hypothetical protein HDU79_004085 [Rhizoclosmatium sp. JEL0117]
MRPFLRSFATAPSSTASPAAKILNRMRVPKEGKAGSASDLLSTLPSSAQQVPVQVEPAPTASSVSLEFVSGFKRLVPNYQALMGNLFGYMASGSSVRLERREAIRNYLRTARDMKVFVPFAFYLFTPFHSATLPVIFRSAPSLLPSTFYTDGLWNLKARVISQKRRDAAASVVDALSKQVDSIGNAFVFEKSTVNAVGLFKKLMLTTSSVTFIDLNSLLYPLFAARLTAGYGLAQPAVLTNYLNFTAPHLFPRTRLLQWADWILKDDAMLRREGVSNLSNQELLEALEERGFKQLDGLNVQEMRALLTKHTKWTKTFHDAVLTKRAGEKLLESSGDLKPVKVAGELGLTAEELGGVATMLVLARALDVAV